MSQQSEKQETQPMSAGEYREVRPGDDSEYAWDSPVGDAGPGVEAEQGGVEHRPSELRPSPDFIGSLLQSANYLAAQAEQEASKLTIVENPKLVDQDRR